MRRFILILFVEIVVSTPTTGACCIYLPNSQNCAPIAASAISCATYGGTYGDTACACGGTVAPFGGGCVGSLESNCAISSTTMQSEINSCLTSPPNRNWCVLDMCAFSALYLPFETYAQKCHDYLCCVAVSSGCNSTVTRDASSSSFSVCTGTPQVVTSAQPSTCYDQAERKIVTTCSVGYSCVDGQCSVAVGGSSIAGKMRLFN